MDRTKFMEIYVFYMETYSQALGRASIIFSKYNILGT